MYKDLRQPRHRFFQVLGPHNGNDTNCSHLRMDERREQPGLGSGSGWGWGWGSMCTRLMAANTTAESSGAAEPGKNNCQQTWKRDQRILRTISLYARVSESPRVTKPGRGPLTMASAKTTPGRGESSRVESPGHHIYCLEHGPILDHSGNPISH